MTEQITEALPEEGGTNSARPDEGLDATRSDYEGWWERAEELHKYIEKLPSSVIEKVDMAERKNKLVVAFDQLASPGSVPEPVPQGAIQRLDRWTQEAKGFVGFLLQSYEPAVPTIQAPILLKSFEQDEDWQWPWIDGWDDPKRRKKIMKPPGKEESQVKRFLIGGAVIGGALLLGKKFMESE